ncbi:BnaA02g22740D [Brassica napus]|uniref:BnaA02g22740D protein n=2 Tax=Brassica TaxID=3705 RepID=A0A078FPZ1_BRANA|nr:BnaA02g22740D [Brassica napus]
MNSEDRNPLSVNHNG